MSAGEQLTPFPMVPSLRSIWSPRKNLGAAAPEAMVRRVVVKMSFIIVVRC